MVPNRLFPSFWGNVSYVGKDFKDPCRVLISMAGVEFRIAKDDPAVAVFHVTSGSKHAFAILEPLEGREGMYRVLALYGYPKANNRLVLSIREKISRDELTMDDLAAWDPDYLCATATLPAS